MGESDVQKDILAQEIYEKAFKKSNDKREELQENFKRFLFPFSIVLATTTLILGFFGYSEFEDIKSGINQKIDDKTKDKISSIDSKISSLSFTEARIKLILENLEEDKKKVEKYQSELIDVNHKLKDFEKILDGNKKINEELRQELKKTIALGQQNLYETKAESKVKFKTLDDSAKNIKSEEIIRNDAFNTQIQEIQKLGESIKNAKLCRVLSAQQDSDVHFDSLGFKLNIGAISDQSVIKTINIIDDLNPTHEPIKLEYLKLGKAKEITRQENYGQSTYHLKVLLLVEHDKERDDYALLELCGKPLNRENN